MSDFRDRCRDYGLEPVVVVFTREQLVERWGDACVFCSTGSFDQVDHRLPVAAGGPHTIENVVPVCTSCNEAKRQLYDMAAIHEFRARVVEVRGVLVSRGEFGKTSKTCDDDGIAT
ncbi:HNH endonuclease [Rhodococcus erythropolis]|uniref:HNH endonuclease n=1 Tax=Rhodococcus erythropolis TaxID=1833 RepID=UPI001BECA32D|nr:HNH endonuclease signature motif containing protein [Rhodococcus erythropolis]MBT2269786.1 HNH endonuclease [Rhodococcus erythropolis]